ncbi:MAG: radical SAM protein [bacterium]|nr:radical SAM protein [bacterium]
MAQYIPIQAKSILNRHRFIDDWTAGRTSINLYRGCEHACVYCDGRTEKYQIEGDFGLEIRVKGNAPQLLRKEFGRIKEPIIIMVGGGVGDLYQPAEKEFQLTRKILELILEFGLPCHILTKSSLILRDFELIKEINKRSQAIVSFSISSLNEDTCRIFEPKAGPPVERIEALRTFAKEGIPTGVWFMPLIPYICDDEKSIEQVVSACSEAGVDFILPALMTLKEGWQKDCFMKVLEAGFPDLVPIYHKIYRENKWGAPEIEYSAIVEERARNICHHYKIPTTARRKFPVGFEGRPILRIISCGKDFQPRELLINRRGTSADVYYSHPLPTIQGQGFSEG